MISHTEANSPSQDTPIMPNERVLLIEDAQAPRSFLSRTLGKIATVVHARSILEGTVQLATMSPKAIIMDWSMPDGNALEGMPEILSIQDDVPVIVLCADLTVDRAVDLMRAGAHDVLPKTIEEDTLQMAVFRAIHADIKMKSAAPELPKAPPVSHDDPMSFSVPLGTPLRQAEEKLIDATLAFCNGSIPACAQVLEVSASTLYRKLEARKSSK